MYTHPTREDIYIFIFLARTNPRGLHLFNKYISGRPLSRIFKFQPWGKWAKRRNFCVARISKNRFSSLARIFQPITRHRNRMGYNRNKTNRPYETDFYLPATTGINSLCQFIDVESARQLDTMLHRVPAHTYVPVCSFLSIVDTRAKLAKFRCNLLFIFSFSFNFLSRQYCSERVQSISIVQTILI